MSKKNVLLLVCSFFFISFATFAQSNEVSFSIGGVFSTDQTSRALSAAILCPITLPNCNTVALYNTHAGVAFMGNFARRITAFGPSTLYVEAPVVGGPARDTNLTFRPIGDILTLSSSSLFFTPSAKFKFRDSSAISPFASVGGGLGHVGLVGAQMNTGALQFGGGVDFKSPIPHLLFRAEARDFFSAASPTRSYQHVVFAGGGAVLRF